MSYPPDVRVIEAGLSYFNLRYLNWPIIRESITLKSGNTYL